MDEETLALLKADLQGQMALIDDVFTTLDERAQDLDATDEMQLESVAYQIRVSCQGLTTGSASAILCTRLLVPPAYRMEARRMVQQQQSTVPARREPPHEKMTYAEFLDWADEDTYAEWVDGDIIMMSAASDRHQDIVDFLISVLRPYVASYELGWVRSAPFQMKTGPELPSREPDILFLHKDHLSRRQDTFLDGPADLVVEVVSPESGPRDRGDKFYALLTPQRREEYEAGGVPEYWLIDPQREQAEFYQLNEEGRYRLGPVDESGRYHSTVITDFWLRVDWLWQEPLPPTEEVLLEVGGEAYARRLIAQLRERGFLTDE